jgi:hypothetical protein
MKIINHPPLKGRKLKESPLPLGERVRERGIFGSMAIFTRASEAKMRTGYA